MISEVGANQKNVEPTEEGVSRRRESSIPQVLLSGQVRGGQRIVFSNMEVIGDV